MAVKITYMVHGTTQDNINSLASGHNDIELSKRGIRESIELGAQRTDNFDIIITSDLKRSIDTAKLAFQKRCVHIQDSRLKECNYGDLTQKPKDWSNLDFVTSKYPNGESYIDVQERIVSFLEFLKKNYDNKHVGIVAHQGPQLALDVLLKGMSWHEAITQDWRNTKNWQPGWEYYLK